MPHKDPEKRLEYCRKWRKENTEKLRKYANDWYYEHTENCCKRSMKWAQKNRKHVYEKRKERYNFLRQKDPYYDLKNTLWGKYKLSLDQFWDMTKKQNGVCAICGQPETNEKYSKRLSVDHDHTTGKMRKLLCRSCNNGLGCFKDNIILMEKATQYLKDHQYETIH